MLTSPRSIPSPSNLQVEPRLDPHHQDHLVICSLKPLHSVRSPVTYQQQLTQFGVCVKQDHPDLGQKALEQRLPFASTYLREASFSATVIKAKQRNRLCLEKSLITAVASLSPRLTKIISEAQCTVGGDFDFNPAPSDPSVDLLLVAGGVGINPSYSTLLHTASLLHLNQASGGRDYKIGSAHLCYSAKNTQELLFKSSIIKACGEFPDKLSCDLHVTQQSTDVDLHLQPFINRGRITEEELQAHVDPQRTLCFLCGPRPMIEALSKTLMDFGLPKDRILFEKWW
ncbi:oxidoreductase NAD-binding domain-containing protein 1-like [Cyclopterus lumpus]|uniref:oxidoreductase NAD-binding domain-containing protein 1-like n=1 Tax=Cyclopterus lumpus TaxID=8103 RepID=UPI0014868E44|nr:oxidoreductase NAD-binding domain-containing protein 1-like [Cyclopterus lumpus]